MIIEPQKGQQYGFTPDKFLGYLYEESDTIWITAVLSLIPKQGNFSSLIQKIESQNKMVKVPIPLFSMQKILKKRKYRTTKEKTQYGEITIMYKDFRESK